MTTFKQFKKTFDDEVKSDIRWDYFGGLFMISTGIILTLLIESGIIKYQGTNTFHFTGFSLLIIIGLTIIYWIKIRYKISSFDKSCTDDQIETGINKIKEKYGMDILINEGTFYSLFYKPSSLRPWTKVYLFYDDKQIYINARPISKGTIDFGFSKRLEKKIVTEIKTCR